MKEMKIEEALTPSAADKLYLTIAKMSQKYATQLNAQDKDKSA